MQPYRHKIKEFDKIVTDYSPIGTV